MRSDLHRSKAKIVGAALCEDHRGDIVRGKHSNGHRPAKGQEAQFWTHIEQTLSRSWQADSRHLAWADARRLPVPVNWATWAVPRRHRRLWSAAALAQNVRAETSRGCSTTQQLVSQTQGRLSLLRCPGHGHSGCSVNTERSHTQPGCRTRAGFRP